MSHIEREVVGAKPEDVGGHTHIERVKLADGTEQTAAEVIAAIESHQAVYTMRPPEGSPAYQAHQETGRNLLIQARQCPDCAETVLYA